MTTLNIRVLRWVSVTGLAVVLLSDLFGSLSWQPRQGYGLVLLILGIAAVALVSVVLMPRAAGTLALHNNILLPLALLIFADRLLGWLAGLPVLGAMLTPSWLLPLFNLSFVVSVHFLINIGLSVAYAAWMTTAVLALVRREQDDPGAALPLALQQFWRVLGLEFIGWAVIMLATALLLLLMPVVGFFALVLMAIFAIGWNFATAAVLPVILANRSGFPEAFRTGVRVSLGNLGKWWLLLLAQMLLLGLFIIIYSNWTDGGTRHGNVSWHVNAFWTGGFENECRWYGKLAEAFHFPKLPIVETLLALLFGVMAVAVKIAIVQRLPVPFGNSLKEASGETGETSESQQFSNPNRIVSASPGLRGTSCPGLPAVWVSTPTRLRQVCPAEPRPRWGWLPRHIFPKVARCSLPWALSRSPFGIRFRIPDRHSG